MSTLISSSLLPVYERLAQAYDWRLVDDEATFLTEAATEYETLSADLSPSARATFAVKRAYSARLYRGLVHRDERAAVEIWQTMMRVVRRDRWPPEEAEDVAHETVAAIIDGLTHKLHSPQTLLWWQFWIYRDVCKRWRKPKLQTVTITPDEEDAVQLSDGAEMADQVEDRLIGGQLLDLLKRSLDEPLRTVLLRTVVLDEKPRHIASALGISEANVRQYKFRALKRLRELDEVRSMLRALAADAGEGSQGAPHP